MCESGPTGGGRSGWARGCLNLPESRLRGRRCCLAGRAPSAGAAALPGCTCQLFGADAEVCVYARKTERNVVLCSHWQRIPVVLHAVYLP